MLYPTVPSPTRDEINNNEYGMSWVGAWSVLDRLLDPIGSILFSLVFLFCWIRFSFFLILFIFFLSFISFHFLLPVCSTPFFVWWVSWIPPLGLLRFIPALVLCSTQSI